MTSKLSYWAQALDNSSPDHIQLFGEEISPNDPIRRQDAVKLVSAVVKQGTRIFDLGGLKLTADSEQFVIEIPSSQRDVAGRIAPMICHGRYDDSVIDGLATEVFAGLTAFAVRIGRTLPPEYSNLTRDAFSALKKKSSRTRFVRVATIVLLALISLAVALGLQIA